MASFYRILLAMMQFALVATAQAQQQNPISQGPDYSNFEQGQVTDGQLNRGEKLNIAWLRKYNPTRANQLESQLKQKKTSLDKVSDNYKYQVKARDQLNMVEKLYHDGFAKKGNLSSGVVEMMVTHNLARHARERYFSDLEKKYFYESAELKRVLQKFELKTNAWIDKLNRAYADNREKMGLPKYIKESIGNISELLPHKFPDEFDDDDQTTEDKSTVSNLDSEVPRIRKEDIKKNRDKKEETNRERRQARGENPKPKPKPGEDRIVEADEGGMLVGKSLKLSDFEGCGAVFLKFDAAENFGWVSTSCPGLTGGRVATQADFLTHCNSFDRPRRHCGPPGPGTEKRIEKSGIQGMPFGAFCLGLHFNILASKGDVFNSTVKAGQLVPVFKYDNNSRNLECFYVSFAQSKALRDRYKNTGKDASPAGPVAEAKPKNDCKPGSGLAGAANCVTERIKGAGTPPGPAPPTIKNGNQGPKRNKDRSPAYASSTDPNTGETITSVGNSDGSRTVTKTDKYGNILSKEKVH